MQLNDLSAQYQKLKDEIDGRIQTVLNHSRFIMGTEITELEEQLASFCGVGHCISCANGTDALKLLFMAFGIGEGDAVFCPDMTFIASVEPACLLGATTVFCDIDVDTYNLCPASLERQIKAVLSEGKYKPKAVVAVDFLGNPCNFNEICKICKKYDIILIEDAAQGFGASYDGKRCGSFGTCATTSFFPSKPLGCYGDGGAVFTDDDGLAELLRSLRSHGKGPKGKYDNIYIGMNSRLDTLQASILLPKLKALREYELDSRQKIAKRYNEAFEGKLIVPHIRENCVSAYAQYALLAEDEFRRNKMIGYLNGRDIPATVFYPTPQHLLPVFKGTLQYEETFINAIDYSLRNFILPMHPYLEESGQNEIIRTVLEAL